MDTRYATCGGSGDDDGLGEWRRWRRGWGHKTQEGKEDSKRLSMGKWIKRRGKRICIGRSQVDKKRRTMWNKLGKK